MKITLLKLYKKVFNTNCPECRHNLDSSFIDFYIRFWKFISMQERYSKNRVTFCSKCHSKIIINDNRFSELLFRSMVLFIFIIFFFASPDLYNEIKQYRLIYLTCLVIVFIYVGFTREIKKIK